MSQYAGSVHLDKLFNFEANIFMINLFLNIVLRLLRFFMRMGKGNLLGGSQS